jgi:hypothetical protein
MAKAPRPGVGKRQEELDEAQQIVTITVRRDIESKGRPVPQSHSIGILNIPMRERIICRKATGLPLTAFWSEDRIDLDSVMVLWWMARRLHGDASLTFDQAAEEWPMDLDIETELDLSIDGASEDDDDPEA